MFSVCLFRHFYCPSVSLSSLILLCFTLFVLFPNKLFKDIQLKITHIVLGGLINDTIVFIYLDVQHEGLYRVKCFTTGSFSFSKQNGIWSVVKGCQTSVMYKHCEQMLQINVRIITFR